MSGHKAVAGIIISTLLSTTALAQSATPISEDVGTKLRAILNSDTAAARLDLDSQFHLDNQGHYLGDVYTASGTSGWGWVGLGALGVGVVAGGLAMMGGGGDKDGSASVPAQTRRNPDFSGMPAGGAEPTAEQHQSAQTIAANEMTVSHHNRAVNQHYALARGITGQGVTIAMTGNGIHNPDGGTLSDSYLGQIDLFEQFTGEEDTTPSGTNLHDTLVAAVLVGARNSSGAVGIAPDAKLLDFKIARSNYTGIIEADLVSNMVGEMMQSGARVFSQTWDYTMSDPAYFYDSEPTRVRYRAVAERLQNLHTVAGGKGGAWVVAAGNKGFDNPDFYMAAMPHWYPALETQMIAVVAIDGPFDPATTDPGTLQLADYSSQCGDAMNWCMAAPGDNIFSTDADGNVQHLSGTSGAAPIVAGSLALIMSAFPEITAETAIKILFDTAVDLGAPGVDPVFGHGMPDLEKALRPVGGTTIQTADEGTQSAQAASFDVPATFGASLTGAVTYTVEDQYQRHFTTSLSGNELTSNMLTGAWRLPVLGDQLGFAMTPAAGGGAMALFGTQNIYLTTLLEFNALHGAKGEGAFAWKGTTITQGAHGRFDLTDGLRLELDVGYTSFQSHRERIVSSVSGVLVGARLTQHTDNLLTNTDSLTLSLGFDPTAVSGTMRGTAPFRGEMRSYRHDFNTEPEVKAGFKYQLKF